MRQRYRDLNGTSGVAAYESGPDFIRVWFAGGHGYEYDAVAPGPHHVAEMKQRAEAGSGLATYISQHVRENYARKLKALVSPLPSSTARRR